MQLFYHTHDFLANAEWVSESTSAEKGPWIVQEPPEPDDIVRVQFGIDEAFNIYIRDAYFINKQGNKVEIFEGSDVFGNDAVLHQELEQIITGYNSMDHIHGVINHHVIDQFVETQLFAQRRPSDAPTM